jgi:hypothetical protein
VRGKSRQRMKIIGTTTVVCAMGVSSIVAIATHRPGWYNYWGGFVYAPFGLVIVVVATIWLLRGAPSPTKSARSRKR